MKVTIIGLGLIGGSLSLRLKEVNFASEIKGVDNNKANEEKALELNIVDVVTDLETGVKEADLIVLAVPVDAIQKLLPKVLDLITKDQVVMEMRSEERRVGKECRSRR